MSFVKMSMFHWHIVDSQSFPLVVDTFPELAQTGAYSSRKVYTPQDVQGIVSYAAQVSIDISNVDAPPDFSNSQLGIDVLMVRAFLSM